MYALFIYFYTELTTRYDGESDLEYAERQAKVHAEVNRRTIVFIHAAFQVRL